MGLGSFFNKIDAPRAHLPVDLQKLTKKDDDGEVGGVGGVRSRLGGWFLGA